MANKVLGTIASWPIVDQQGLAVCPHASVFVGEDLYFLGNNCLWCVPLGKRLLRVPQLLKVTCFAAASQVKQIPIQEFTNFAYCPKRRSLIVLDKSGDIFEFQVLAKTWQKLPASDFTGNSLNADCVDLATSGERVCLLAASGGNVWQIPGTGKLATAKPSKELKKHVSGMAVACDHTIYLLQTNGKIVACNVNPDGSLIAELSRVCKLPNGTRPSRIYTGANMPLYVIERENNRVIAINKRTGALSQYLFPASSNLRGLVPASKGFWIIDNDKFVWHGLSQTELASLPLTPRVLDLRLNGFILPLKGVYLPWYPNLFPGAARRYRMGVHKGLDFFQNTTSRATIAINTAVYAAQSGYVVRVDHAFADMSPLQYSKVIAQCFREHVCSKRNEDLLRGCQVWIDHGHGVVTRYAHLNKVNSKLKYGMKVLKGSLIGYVGVSGTKDGVWKMIKHPHLHFEIWLDDKYLGSGLTVAETVSLYQKIFEKHL